MSKDENETPTEQFNARDIVTSTELRSLRKEMLQNFQHLVETIETNRHAVGITLESIKLQLGGSITTQAVIENRLSMVERIVYGLCAVVGLTVVGSILALVLTKGHT